MFYRIVVLKVGGYVKIYFFSNNVGYPFKICGWMQKYEKITLYWVGVILKATYPPFFAPFGPAHPPVKQKYFFSKHRQVTPHFKDNFMYIQNNIRIIA